MFSRPMLVRFAALRSRAALGLLALIGGGCGADHIVAVDAGTGSHRVTAAVGDLVDIRLWGGALGTYASPPTVSAPAVVFVDVSTDGPPNPGGPTQRFRFRAASRGTAVVTFSPLQSAPVVTDTVIVR
jgi:hypothetical protein